MRNRLGLAARNARLEWRVNRLTADRDHWRKLAEDRGHLLDGARGTIAGAQQEQALAEYRLERLTADVEEGGEFFAATLLDLDEARARIAELERQLAEARRITVRPAVHRQAPARPTDLPYPMGGVVVPLQQRRNAA